MDMDGSLPGKMKFSMKTTKAALFGFFTIKAALAGQVQAQSFLTNGLVAYYPFNGNGNDASGNGNNIVSPISLAPDRFGAPFSAAVLSQAMWATNFIYVQSNASRTVSEWVKVRDYPGNTTWAWGWKPSANFVNLVASTDGANCLASDGEFWLDNGSGAVTFFQLPAPTNWSHIVVVCSGGTDTAQVYFDGQLIPSKRGVQVLSDTIGSAYRTQEWPVFDELHYVTGPGNIGFSANNFVDDVRIYNRALSPSEVQQLYAYESQPIVRMRKALSPSFSNLYLGTNYQLQVSGDLNTWTNNGSPFSATNTVMDYPQYFDVDDWAQLFFRLQATP